MFSQLKSMIYGILFLSVSLTAHAQLYNLNDLEILAQNGEYEEFFAHAKDVKPTKRNKTWQNLVIKQASEYIDHFRSVKNYKRSALTSIERLATWPILKRDEFFQIRRNSYAKEYFHHCFLSDKKDHLKRSHDQCYRQLITFWQRSNKDVDTGYQLSYLGHSFFGAEKSWTLISDIIKSEKASFYCDKGFVKEQMTRYLKTMDLAKIDTFGRKVRLQNLASLECWNKIIPSLKDELSHNGPREYQQIYLTLKAFNQLNKLEQEVWLVRYLLDRPTKGDTLNTSWNLLKELSQNYEQRMLVLKKLMALSPLPGRTFTMFSPAIVDHFQKYFPEYLKQYSKLCLSYLEGKATFTHGNPTPHCDELFAHNKKRSRMQIFSDRIQKRYSAIKKI